ncbi:CDP-glycerol glycerophosphotransferase family protein [Ideonella sp. DXS29W]|uniref:CDP-glycerol glycerophosphotransferase family protein n=1 Tax=Ideonella lacteola TaxID=2984193 RepID=A0ABU9C1V1_9BURK
MTAQNPEQDGLRKLVARHDDQQLGREFAELSHKVKKRPMVLFFGRTSFADNSKYLFLRALSAQRGYDVMWCTHSTDLAVQLTERGLPCLLLGLDADQTIDTLLHAAVAVFTLNPWESVGMSQPLLGCLAGAKQVQLWHGVSVKRLTLQLLPHFGARSSDIRPYWLSSIAADHVLSTASHFDAYWREVFGCRSLVRAGLPRNEVLLRSATEMEHWGAELSPRAREALESGRPSVLVVPTWQRNKWTELTGSTFLAHAVKFARDHKANIFFKAHPTYFGHWNQQDQEVDGLHLIDPGLDIYPWMSRFSALVTDYSSIMFDYLLTGKPVLTLDLKPGDHQKYEPDYSLVPEGDFRTTYTTETLAAKLKKAVFDDKRQDSRQAYARQIFESDPLSASEDLLQLIDTLVDRSQQPDFKVWQPGSAL